MGKAISYYLIARDRDTNEFEVLRVNGKRNLSLEEIDLYTMSFNDSKDLSTALGKKDNIDYYIAYQQKRGNEISLKTDEVIYANSSNLRNIAINSKNKRITASEEDIMALLNQFCRKMTQTEYYNLVMAGRTNIYSKLTKLFFFSRYHTANELRRKEGTWLIKSYSLARNIVESMTNNHWHSSYLSDQMYRGLIENRVREQADPKFDENQISLFDLFPEERKNDNSDVFAIMKTIENLPYELIMDESFTETLPIEIRENVIRLVKNRCYNDNELSYYSSNRAKKIEKMSNEIIEKLKDEDVKNKVSKWCNIYNESKDKVSGDVNGYSYTKGNKQ